MATYKLGIHEKAIVDLGNACDYYDQQRSGLGVEFEEEVFGLLEVIKKNPLLFPVKFARIHEAVVSRFPFVVNYEVIGKEIVVLAVFHVKQHPSKKTKRRSS